MASGGNIALAFGLVIAAGACTCLGALLVFCSNLANPKWLSGSLGASAGVMIYISFVEILSIKAVQGFQASGLGEAAAQRYACFSFFAGLMATWLLGKALELASRGVHAWQRRKAAHQEASATAHLPTTTAVGTSTTTTSSSSSNSSCVVDADIEIPDIPARSDRTNATADQEGSVRCCGCAGPRGLCEGMAAAAAGGGACSNSVERKEAQRDLLALLAADNHGVDLKRMGVLTGLAVGLHNVPEGVATFAAALASPATGVVIAIAIALHNIPEGVAVALPLYYATGSKWKGLMWASISGAAEPLGGLIGYAVLSSAGMSQLAFGVMFAFVAGIMVYIAIRELLPTALRYDPKDGCVTACAFWGMAIMAASLLLFKA